MLFNSYVFIFVFLPVVLGVYGLLRRYPGRTRPVSWIRITKYKPKRLEIDRLIKPYEVWKYEPRTVFLGTSSIHQAVDPSVLDRTHYAASVQRVHSRQLARSEYFAPATVCRPESDFAAVFVELFLYNFLGQGQERPPKSLREYIQNTVALFVSADALLASAQTLWYNVRQNAPTYEIKPRGFFYPPGHIAKGPFGGFPAGIWEHHNTRADGMKLHGQAFESVREFIARWVESVT